MNTSTAAKSPRSQKIAAGKAAKLAHIARMAVLHAAARAIVEKGVCPDCGTKLYRNLSISGWYQCGHYGSPGFQKEPSAKHCSFQTFTE